MSFFRLSLFVVVFSYCSVVSVAQETSRPALSPVGMTTRAFVDGARKNWQDTGPRPLNTVIWYPAAAGSPVRPFVATSENTRFFGDPAFAKFFSEIPVAFNAPLASGQSDR